MKNTNGLAIKRWINKQIGGTSVTIVLVGEKTCRNRWFQYEINVSKSRGNGLLLGIDISKIKDLKGNISERCGQIPHGYDFYLWNKDNGYKNMGDWIEKAAQQAGK